MNCNKINIVYPPDPACQIYTGRLNYIDRDYWNQALEQRSFLLQRPPIHNIVYPQSTDFCNYKGCVAPIFNDPSLQNRSEVYYNNFLSQDPRSLGLPTTGNSLCVSRAVYDDSSKTVPPNNPCLSNGQRYPIAVTTVNRNVDSESVLRNLNHYCPSDVFDSRIVENKNNQNSYSEVFPTCVRPMKGIETPLVWRNVTKMLNRYNTSNVCTC